jgi:hypothetical protein
MYSWFRRHPTVADAAWAGLLFLLCALVVAVNLHDSVRAYALAGTTVVLCSMLVIRRSRPDLAVWVGIGVGLIQIACNSPINLADVALLVLAYTAAAFAHVWTSRAALIAGLTAGPLALLRFYGHDDSNPRPSSGMVHTWADVFMAVVFSTPFLLCWVLGRPPRSSPGRRARAPAARPGPPAARSRRGGSGSAAPAPSTAGTVWRRPRS